MVFYVMWYVLWYVLWYALVYALVCVVRLCDVESGIAFGSCWL